jgi:hypothetical protein
LIDWFLLRCDIHTLITNFINSAANSHHHLHIWISFLLILHHVLLLEKLVHFLIGRTECISIYFVDVALHWCHLLQRFEVPCFVLTLSEVVYCIVNFEGVLCWPFFIVLFFLQTYWFSHVKLGDVGLVNYMFEFITYWNFIVI